MTLRNKSVIRILARLAVFPVLLLALGCPSKKEIQASIWLNDSLVDVCEQYPGVERYGFYRQLNNGTQEFISYCNPLAKEMLGMHKSDFERFVKETWPETPSESAE